MKLLMVFLLTLWYGDALQAHDVYGKNTDQIFSAANVKSPIWGQPGNGPLNNGYTPNAGPEGLTPLLIQSIWYDASLHGGNFVIDGSGDAYYKAGGVLTAISLKQQGLIKWTAACVECSNRISTDSSNIYVGGDKLRAFDVNDGQMVWELTQADLGVSLGKSNKGITSDLRISSDGVLFFSFLERIADDYRSEVFALDLITQKVIWSKQFDDRVSNIAVAGDGTIVLAGRILRALRPDNGAPIWSAEIEGLGVEYAPAISEDGIIYLPSNKSGTERNESHIYAIYLNDGRIKWQIRTGFLEVTPAIGKDGTIYFHNYIDEQNRPVKFDPGVYALNPDDGSIKWKYTPNCPKWSVNRNPGSDSSPTVDRNGAIYFGVECGLLFSINADGTLKWRLAIDSEFDNRPVIDNEGNLFICHAGGGPGDWWHGGYRCYIIGDSKGEQYPEPDTMTPFDYCLELCMESGNDPNLCMTKTCPEKILAMCTGEVFSRTACGDPVLSEDKHTDPLVCPLMCSERMGYISIQ